jgi:hypothetical protein
LRLDLIAQVGPVLLYRILVHEQKHLVRKPLFELKDIETTTLVPYSLIVQNPRHTRKVKSAALQDLLRLVRLGSSRCKFFL